MIYEVGFMRKHTLSIRKQRLEDIPLIVDYFLNASDEHLANMGVDRPKLFERAHWIKLLHENYDLEDKHKKLFYVIWQIDDEPIGHCNINKITINEEAYMHLHLWQNDTRQKGLGLEFLKLSIPLFFETFNIKNLYCEPYALNPAPNMTLSKFGFEFIKQYEGIPGTFSFIQLVNKWCLTQEKFTQILNQ
jgi:[ribosomal protein S5]-alanine N-acetyltransferase